MEDTEFLMDKYLEEKNKYLQNKNNLLNTQYGGYEHSPSTTEYNRLYNETKLNYLENKYKEGTREDSTEPIQYGNTMTETDTEKDKHNLFTDSIHSTEYNEIEFTEKGYTMPKVNINYKQEGGLNNRTIIELSLSEFDGVHVGGNIMSDTLSEINLIY